MGGSRRALKRVVMGDRGNMRKMMRIYEENKRTLLILTTGFPTALLLLLLLPLLLAVLLLFLCNGDGVVD